MRLRLGLLCIALFGCGGTGFKDELTFGTGIDATGFKLVGEADTFTLTRTTQLWFRLESAANFEGRFVRLYLNKLEQRDYAACANPDAHLCLSTLSASNPGTYQVDAYLVKTVIDIGQETRVASRTLTLR